MSTNDVVCTHTALELMAFVEKKSEQSATEIEWIAKSNVNKKLGKKQSCVAIFSPKLSAPANEFLRGGRQTMDSLQISIKTDKPANSILQEKELFWMYVHVSSSVDA